MPQFVFGASATVWQRDSSPLTRCAQGPDQIHGRARALSRAELAASFAASPIVTERSFSLSSRMGIPIRNSSPMVEAFRSASQPFSASAGTALRPSISRQGQAAEFGERWR